MNKMRRTVGAVLVLIFLLLPGMGVYAAEAGVFDGAGLFTSEESEELQREAEEISREYDMNILVVTTVDAEGKNARDYADDYYMNHGYYDNGAKGGTLYLIDMDNREIYMCNTGDMSRFITDVRREDVLDAGYEQVANGEYHDCIANMMSETVHWLERGIPSDQYTYEEETEKPVSCRSITFFEWAMALVLALAAGCIAVGIVRRRYRTKWSSYKYPMKEKSRITITGKEDRLVNQVVTTRVIHRNPPPPSGGGRGNHMPTHASSGGRGFSSGGSRTTTHTSSSGGSFSGSGRKVGHTTTHTSSGGGSFSGSGRKVSHTTTRTSSSSGRNRTTTRTSSGGGSFSGSGRKVNHTATRTSGSGGGSRTTTHKSSGGKRLSGGGRKF